MGVYINMEMPKSCYVCPFCDYVSARCDAVKGNPYTPESRYEKRADFCPLVPVPPHGDLIDRDALADVFRGFIAMYDSCPFSQLSFPDKARRDELQSALAEVINAPTIIPAEEGET